MNQIDIEALANTVCFSTNIQIKQQAQKIFLNFCNQLSPTDYKPLMGNYSQTVIFVLMEYTYRILQSSTNIQALYVVISRELLSLYHSQTGSFVREGKIIEKYVVNSIGRTLGESMKILFRQKQMKTWLLTSIKSEQQSRFRLYLWKIFIQSISQIDNNLGFLHYRNLVYSFQEEVIPTIVEELIPYFMSVTQSIRINQQSTLLDSLNLSQTAKKQYKLFFTVQQERFCQLVFNVLKDIICFTYNITYSQYDLENSFENSSICFPQAFTAKIVSKDFIQSLYFIIEKLISDFPNSQFLGISLDCLQKVLLCRLTYIQKPIRKAFMCNVITGMNRLFTNPKITPKILLKLIDANIKFINNIEMHKLRKFQPAFTGWLHHIKNIAIQVCSKMQLNYDNELLKLSLDLMNKILALSISPKLQSYNNTFRNIGVQVLDCFLRYFFNGEFKIMGQTNIRKIKQLKKISSLFFYPIKILFTINFKRNLSSFGQICQIIYNSNNWFKISNLILLITEITETSFYDRNIFYQNPTKQQIKGIGTIIAKTLQFIIFFRKSNQSVDLLEISFMIFMQKFISECLKNIDWKNNAVCISSTLYQIVNAEIKSDSDENFLMGCFKQIILGLQSTQKQRVQYALEILSCQLMKFKWGLKRDNFKSTRIANEMLLFCSQTSASSLKGDAIKLRKQLFKIITLVSFDDVMDSFKENIEKVVGQIASRVKTNLQETIYDLTGICQTIDASNIYKYFLLVLDKEVGIKALMNQLFNQFGNDPKQLKAILKLHISLLQNKSQRLSNMKIITKLYQLIGILLPFWNEILKKATTQQWENIVIQIHKAFRVMIRGGHINFFLIQKFFPEVYNSFILLMIENMNHCSVWASHYPKLFQLLLDNGLTIVRQLLEVILMDNNPSLVQSFSKIITFYTTLNIKFMKELADGNKKVQSQLQKTLDINRCFFTYLRTGMKYSHRIAQLKNIEYLIKFKNQQKQQYLLELFQFCLGNGRSYQSSLRTVYSIIQQLSVLINNSYQVVMKKLGVDETKIKRLSTIWNSQIQGESDLFICNLKDWFKLCDSDYIIDIDY